MDSLPSVRSIPSLGDLCLRTIIKHSETLQSNFDLPVELRQKVLSELIERNKITDSSFQSFSTTLETVSLKGCSHLSSKALLTLGQNGNHIRELDFSLCPAATDEVLSSLSSSCPGIQNLVLNNCPGITAATLVSIAKNCPGLSHLQLAGFTQQQPGLKYLLTMTNLQSLSLENWGSLTDQNLINLGTSLPLLHSLDLTNCRRITTAGIKGLLSPNPTKFQVLKLAGCLRINSECLTSIASCSGLRAIALNSGNGINDEGLKQLGSCKQLCSVSLSYLDSITNEGIKELLVNASQLRHVSFLFLRQVDTYAFKHLANCRKITVIRWEGKTVTIRDEDLIAVVPSLPGLEELYLQDCAGVTDEGIVALAKSCTRLRVIYISSCPKFTDKALEALAAYCPNLSVLVVDSLNRGISDAGLIALSKGCVNLTMLNIFNGHLPAGTRNPNLTDVGVLALTTLSKLQTLWLRYFSITDAVLEHFLSLTEITMRCKWITEQGIDKLVANNQNLRVLSLEGMEFPIEAVERWRGRGVFVDRGGADEEEG